jgi:hypothetical protein
MLTDDIRALGEIDAVGFVVGDVGFDPLNVGAEFTQHGVGFRGGGLYRLPVGAADFGKLTLDDELAHVILPRIDEYE